MWEKVRTNFELDLVSNRQGKKMSADNPCQAFIAWFQKNGGSIDLTAMGIADLPLSEGGRGAIALKDIPVSPDNCVLGSHV